MYNQVQWEKSGITPSGNVYHYYPRDDDLFKGEVVRKGGMIVEIYENGKLIGKRQTRSQGTKWISPIFSYLKTMTTNGVKFEKCYKNCYLYAYPIGYESEVGL